MRSGLRFELFVVGGMGCVTHECVVFGGRGEIVLVLRDTSYLPCGVVAHRWEILMAGT
jgi:hypothetical protein